MQSQTISVPVVFSQVNIALGEYSQQKSSAKISNTTTTTSYRSSPVQTIYREYKNDNQSVYMTVSSSSSSKKTTTTTRINNKSKNSNNMTASTYIIGNSSSTKNSIDVPFLVSLFSISFKYIFIITANVLDKLLFIVLNPVETLICISYRISEIRAMTHQLEELKYERTQLINQGEQLMVQLNAARICYRNIETSYRAMKQKRDILKDTIKALQNELQRERESRYVVEKCHNERIEKLEFEIDMKEQEIMKFEDKEKLLKKKIHKLQKKLKKSSSNSTCLSLPTFSLQNFNTFSFEEPLRSKENTELNKEGENCITEGDNDNNSEDLYYSESEDENFVFVKDSDAESCTDSSSAGEWDSESESELDSESEINSDLEDVCGIVTREIPKNSIYYNFGRCEEDTKDEEDEEELELKNKIEQNPMNALRQEAYNCLYQSLISELSTSSILMDLDVKLDKSNLNSYTCISIILEAIIHYMETKNQLLNTEAIDEMFIRYRPLILSYTDSEEDQMNLLLALENICIENSIRLQQHLRILMAVFKAELVDSNIIIKWYRLLPDSEESNHRSCPMTPSFYCTLPELPLNSSKIVSKSYSYSEGDYKRFGQMIDGHYATNAIPSSLEDNANISSKSEGSVSTNDHIKNEIKAIKESLLHIEEPSEIANKSLNLSKAKNGHGGRSGHARTASGSILRRKRSMSNASDTNSHEIYYLRLRRDVRELAKVFALWLESKESSSSDEESMLDNMSMSQEFDSDSEDSGIGNELQRIHRKLLSDDDTCDTNSNSNSNGLDDEISDIISEESYNGNHLIQTGTSLKKCSKRVTFNLSHMEEKDEDETINNDEEEVNASEIKLNEESPLLSCFERNPLSFSQFEFNEGSDGGDSEEEEVIEEVEEVIEEEEIIEEEIVEETINGNDDDNEDDESVTIVEEKEEIIDEVVECIKVTS